MLLMLIAETIAVFHGMLWLEPTALAPYLGFILVVPLWTAAPVAAIAIWLAFFLSYRIEEKSGQELPEPPAAIRDWLEAHDHRHGIAWWHETRRSEEHTSELQSLMRNSYAVCCLKKKKKQNKQ